MFYAADSNPAMPLKGNPPGSLWLQRVCTENAKKGDDERRLQDDLGDGDNTTHSMKKILIAFDDSPGAEAAMLDLVRGGLPEACDARVLTIADVWLPPDPLKAEPVFPDRVSASRTEARQHAVVALEAAKEISKRGAVRLHGLFPKWTIHPASHADSPAWGILAESRRWSADLIVIGSHGRSPLQKFFLGSVSHKVAAEAECSVRVFRAQHRDSDPSLRILIGVDGSGDADAAIEEALSRHWPASTRFQLVSVVDNKLKTAAVGDGGIFPAQHSLERIEDWLGPFLAERAARFEQRRFTATTHILEGDPKAELLRQAEEWEADGIFLGARGLQHGNRLYLGTLVSAVAARARCTVEIVRPRRAAEPAK